ncbi:MAG: hypothetical protein F4169_04485 [Gammaproteobacteria bacterium]|nr:hypothetical protein [Gammaproteobacteria bacterium]
MFSSLIDPYELKARVLPALIHISPLLPLFIGVPILNADVTGSGTLATLLFLAFTVLLSNAVRPLGKRLENRLIDDWGGLPTTILLRYSDTSINLETKKRYHVALEVLLAKSEWPTVETERANPKMADAVYESAIDALRERTRDRDKYRLVFAELANYGFARNLRGGRPIGLILAALLLILDVTVIAGNEWLTQLASPLLWHFGTLCALVFVVVLLTFFGNRFVREAGDNYARALLATLDSANA